MTRAILLLLAAAALPDPTLASYRGGQVSKSEYESWLLARGLTPAPERRRAELEDLALAESLEASALQAGLDREPATAFRLAESERSLLVAALQARVNAAVRIGEAQIEQELKAEDQERYKPRKLHLRNIFKRAPAGASKQTRAALRQRLEDVRRQLLEGADFDALAYRESDSQTRFQGGAMGFVPPGRLQPEIERAAFALQQGELSPVLETAEGFTLLRCDGIAEARVMPLDKARAMIKQGLWTRATDASWRALRDELLREAAPRFAEDGAPAGSELPAATFAGGRITWSELGFFAHANPSGLSAAARRQHLEELVFRLMAERRARREGLDTSPELRAKARWSRARLLATAEMARRVNLALVPPTDGELRKHFEARRSEYVKPTAVDFSVIRSDLQPEKLRQQFAEAEELLTRLQAGAIDFAEAARSVSQEVSARDGGRLGFLAPAQVAARFGPNVFKVLTELKPGELSGLVQQDRSLWIVKLWERRPERPQTFEEAANKVEQELGNARVKTLQEELETKARAALGFELEP